VLIKYVDEDLRVFGIVILVLLLVVGPLALWAGADSRVDDVERRRRYMG
jgi:hypothetical protein